MGRNNVFQEYDYQTGALNLHYTMEMTGDPVGNHPQGPSNVYSQRQVPTNTSSFYGFDLAGNTRIVMDGSGNISDTLLYSAFGEQLLRTGSTVFYYGFGGAAGYIGLDGQLFEARNRFYSPFNGVWTRLDPIGFAGGLWNLYCYVGNNPLRNLDPWGEDDDDDDNPIPDWDDYWNSEKSYIVCLVKCLLPKLNPITIGCEFVRDFEHLIKALWTLSTISPNDIIDDLGHYFDQGDARKLLALIVKLNKEKRRLKLTRSWRNMARELEGIETTSEDIANIEQKVLTRLEASVHLRESLLDKSKDVVAGQLVTDLIECTADCYGVEDNPYVKLFATALPILVDLFG